MTYYIYGVYTLSKNTSLDSVNSGGSGGDTFLETRNSSDLRSCTMRGILRWEAGSLRWSVTFDWFGWSNIIVTMYFSCFTILPTVPVIMALCAVGTVPQRWRTSPFFMGEVGLSREYLSSQITWC